MMNVANKGIIRKLTARFLKSARTRNIIAVIAIALTSVLFTSVFTLGGNMLAVIQDQTMRQVGTIAHGGLKYLTREQYENFAQSPLIKEISYRKGLSVAMNASLMKEYSEICYSEDTCAKWMFSFPDAGKMPQSKNEIACSTIVLDALGIPHRIGAELPLEFTVSGREYSEVFTLSGYWTGDPALTAQQIWVSAEYVDTVVSENVISDDEIIAGKIFADVMFGNSFDIRGKIERLIEERGYAAGEIQEGVNWAYSTEEDDLDPVTTAIGILALALILFSGYLIIYSVFAISVNSDIHFYGLLKTIGTTGKQLRKIIHGQAFMLSAFGIPAGLLLGYLSGILLTPAILSTLSIKSSVLVYTAHPLIFVFSAAFSLLTVFISCRKPGKIAGKVSPVEAAKYSSAAAGSKRKVKKTRAVTPLSMAWANVTREKRKLCMIVLSLSLALVLLNSAVSATRSFDMDLYLTGEMINDFAVTDSSLLNNFVFDKKTESITADFLDELAARGISDIRCIYYFENYEHELTPRAHENFIRQTEADRQMLERYYKQSIPAFEQRMKDGKLPTQIYGVGQIAAENFIYDYNKLASGDYALSFNNPVYKTGDTITLTNSEGESRSFEIIDVLEVYPYSISAKFGFIPGQTIALADNIFRDFFNPQNAMQVNFNAAGDRLSETEAWLADYTSRINPALGYISRETLRADFEGLQKTYLTLGGAMSFILALIGILNFINAIVASIIASRRELAMLQSVGMTGKQMRSTLFYEGFCYTVLTAFFTLTAGYGVGWLIVKVIAGQTWFFRQSFTLMPSLYCMIPLFLICVVVPVVCHKRLVRESLVERLRVE